MSEIVEVLDNFMDFFIYYYYYFFKFGFTQPVHDVPGMSLEDPLKVLTPGTYRELSGDFLLL